jgi:hypothetical protein
MLDPPISMMLARKSRVFAGEPREACVMLVMIALGSG